MNKFIWQADKLESSIKEIIEKAKTKTETVQVQITLKGYDLKKDKKFDARTVLPYPIRKFEKILVVGDSDLEAQANKYELPFISFDAVTGTTDDRKKLKKKLLHKHNAIITSGVFHKHLEMKIFNNKNVPFFLLKPNVDLKTFYDEVLRTVRFKLRLTNALSFTAGTAEMDTKEVAENAATGLKFLCGELKKGISNVDGVFIKTTQGKPIKVQ